MPHKMSAMPETRCTHRPFGSSFSPATRTVSPTTHQRFITPPTKSSAINIQQQPTQKAPWMTPTLKAPVQPGRQWRLMNCPGERHWLTQADFIGENW